MPTYTEKTKDKKENIDSGRNLKATPSFPYCHTEILIKKKQRRSLSTPSLLLGLYFFLIIFFYRNTATHQVPVTIGRINSPDCRPKFVCLDKW